MLGSIPWGLVLNTADSYPLWLHSTLRELGQTFRSSAPKQNHGTQGAHGDDDDDKEDDAEGGGDGMKEIARSDEHIRHQTNFSFSWAKERNPESIPSSAESRNTEF